MANYLNYLSINKEVEIDLDPCLTPLIIQYNPNIVIRNNHLRIPVNLFKLIVAVGTIQTRRDNPTNRMKFMDKCDLLESIHNPTQNSGDFKIKVNKDREIQGGLSEDLGIGLSVLIADYLFKLKWSKLAKIEFVGDSQPDIKCFTGRMQQIVIEAKGTTKEATRKYKQKPDALNKKRNKPADIHVASCALLKENSISNVEFLDPPIIPSKDKEYAEKLLMADHYTRAFNFIGQKELSEYFNLMRKRIIHDTFFNEFGRKVELFEKIKQQYLKINLNARCYLGRLERIDAEDVLFIGIDESLISLQGFLEFEDYKEDNIKKGGNLFHITPDGICFARIKNLDFINDQIKEKRIEIPHYQDSISLIDIDSMSELSLNRFIAYLFQNIGGHIEQEKRISRNYLFDQIIEYKNKKIAVEVKKSIKKREELIINLFHYKKELKVDKVILITPKEVDVAFREYASEMDITIISRVELEEILENRDLIRRYL